MSVTLKKMPMYVNKNGEFEQIDAIATGGGSNIVFVNMDTPYEELLAYYEDDKYMILEDHRYYNYEESSRFAPLYYVNETNGNYVFCFACCISKFHTDEFSQVEDTVYYQCDAREGWSVEDTELHTGNALIIDIHDLSNAEPDDDEVNIPLYEKFEEAFYGGKKIYIKTYEHTDNGHEVGYAPLLYVKHSDNYYDGWVYWKIEFNNDRYEGRKEGYIYASIGGPS